MRERCPNSHPRGKVVLTDYQLCFDELVPVKLPKSKTSSRVRISNQKKGWIRRQKLHKSRKNPPKIKPDFVGMR